MVDRTESDIAVLERFVVENDDLAELEAEIGRLNIFDALGIVHAEIRHSNFLAWLLDPAESHGQGQLFLSAVLMDILRNAPPEARPLSPIDLDGADLRGVQVRREWRHIDVLIVIDEPRVVVAIENKILSGEHSNQLSRYAETVAAGFPGHRAFHVFLTREGDEPSDEAWSPYDFGQLHAALDRCVRRNEDSIGEEVRVFVGHYLAMLRSRFMDDPKIDELVDRIYRNHRQALDLIFERKSDPRAIIVRAFIDALQGEIPEMIVQGGSYAKSFAPKSFTDILAGVEPGKALYHNAQIHGFVRAGPNRCLSRISYRIPSDNALHGRVLNALDAVPKLTGLAKIGETTEKKRPIYSIQIAKSSAGIIDDEPTLARVEDAAKRFAERFRQIEDAIRARLP
jgi:hypothetical protein